ncbi:MAG TPA: hypothetical protein VGR31_06975 [Planctomycetota bacterium]|jgi:hypothetical protein|nr:hypothetical protein [Planctomycetota bacterium]
MSAELDRSLAQLEALAARGGRPSRYDARELLLALGESPAAGGGARARIEALPPTFREAWEAAVRDELSMAGTEHVRSVDPRYLDRPGYDFEYTIEARERLETRLRGAEQLGLRTDEALAAAIRRADELLRTQLERRDRKSRDSR